MYPTGELKVLGAGKDALRRRISMRRVQCAAAAARVARPLEWVERGVAAWRRILPWAMAAAVPLGFLFRRRISRRWRPLAAALRWGPLVFDAARTLAAGGPRATKGLTPATRRRTFLRKADLERAHARGEAAPVLPKTPVSQPG